jgi:hypothetical protein
VAFLTDILEFVFVASDLIDAGWDIKAWSFRLMEQSAPYGFIKQPGLPLATSREKDVSVRKATKYFFPSLNGVLGSPRRNCSIVSMTAQSRAKAAKPLVR